MKFRRQPAKPYVSPYRHIYNALESDDPEKREVGKAMLMASGPVPGSFGDNNSYGLGPCGHMAPYPGCPKCWRV